MKDLIKEILLEEKLHCYNDQYKDGFNDGLDKAIEILTQHNLITAPKSVKLSEVVSRLEEVMLGCDSKIHIERFGKHILIFEKTIRNLTLIAEFNLNNNNIKGVNTIVSIREEYFLSSLKWLYALWIAGSEIIDDLEEENNEI